MDIIINFSFNDKMRLLNHASSILSGGHWGSSDLIIPEQQILFEKIQNIDGETSLTCNYLKILIDWIYEGTHEGTLLVNEDLLLITKLNTALFDYYSNLKDTFILETSTIETSINILNELLDKPKIDLSKNDPNNDKVYIKNHQNILNELDLINNKLEIMQNLIIVEKNKKQKNGIIKKLKLLLDKIKNLHINSSDTNDESINSIKKISTKEDIKALYERTKNEAKMFKKSGF